MATNKKNMRQQLRNELYRQYNQGKGTSRHQDKMDQKSFAIYNKLYSNNSLKTHLSRADQFAQWLKSEKPQIKQIEQIDRKTAIEYLQSQKANGKAFGTIKTDMSLINRIKIGRNEWQQGLTKKEADLPKFTHDKVINNRERREYNYNANDKQVIEFGRAFGLRRSELIPQPNSQGYAVTTNSLYERKEDGRLMLCTFGKGGKFRTVEVLKSHEDHIREEYGQYIQLTSILPNANNFEVVRQQGDYLFQSCKHDIQIHIECRQYYANMKLNELEAENRRFELTKQNKLKSGYDRYTTNGRTMLRDQAQFVSQQMGHNRISELSKYVNLNDFDA